MLYHIIILFLPGKDNIMRIYGKISFKEALVVDEHLLRELEKTILSFYDSIAYSCKLCNSDKIEFDSLDELLSYENYKIRKIVKLSIEFGIGNNIAFEPDRAMLVSYKYTVQGDFVTEDQDNSILFQSKVKDILLRNRQNKWYTIITKMNLIQFNILLLGVLSCVFVYGFFTHNWKMDNNVGTYIYGFDLGIVAGIVMGGVFILLGGILAKCRDFLLPPIAYKIGEQIKEIEKAKDLFSKIFWGIVVTFIVSLITAIIV